MLLVFLLSSLTASTYTIGKMILFYSPPIFLIGFRLFVAGILFLSFYLFSHHQIPKLTRNDYWLLLQVTIFSFFLGFMCEFWALDRMTSAKTAFLGSLSPMVTALLSYLVFREKMTSRKILGLALALISLLPSLVASTPDEGKTFVFISTAELVLFAAICSFAYGWVVMRKGLRYHTLASSFIAGVGMLGGGMAALFTSYVTEIQPEGFAWWLPVTQVKPFFYLTALLILIGNIICYVLYAYLLKRYTATLVTFGELTVPIFAAFYGWYFLQESIPWYFYGSMCMLIIGMYVFYQEEKRLGYYYE